MTLKLSLKRHLLLSRVDNSRYGESGGVSERTMKAGWVTINLITNQKLVAKKIDIGLDTLHTCITWNKEILPRFRIRMEKQRLGLEWLCRPTKPCPHEVGAG